MRFRWQRFDRRRPPLGTTYGAVLAGGAILAATWIGLDLPRMACPLRQIVGLPCPTCGSTRMVEALLRGDLATAFTTNPLVFLALVVLALWSVGSTLRRIYAWPAPQAVCTSKDRLWFRVAVVLVVVTSWGYVILRETAQSMG